MPPNKVQVPAAATRIDFAQARADVSLSRAVPVEAAVQIVFGGVPYAVMMATPADLEDFAYGFALTEGIVADASAIRSVDVSRCEDAVRIDVALSGDAMHAHLARRRAMAGRTGCGVCGIEDPAHLPRATRAAGAALPIAIHAIARALADLDHAQPLNDATHAVHGAAFAARDGAILLAREDVGRHNALDKLAGALLRTRQDAADGFIVITSRCSFEMAEKAAAIGARCLVAISAPTSLAIARAEALGLTLVALARADSALVFTHGDCIGRAAREVPARATHE